MKTEFIDVTPTQKQLVFEVPADLVEQEVTRVVRDYGKAARIPGFRPGKAPAHIVRKRFRGQILSDVMQGLIPRVVDDALRERALEPVETPDIRDVTLEDGQPLKFTAAFETVPPIEPIDYAGMSVRQDRIEVGDEAVAGVLERLRDRHARFEPVEGRPSEMGDVLTATVTRRVVEPPASAEGATPPSDEPERLEDARIELGAKANPPGFDEPLLGAVPGDERNFSVRFPADYPIADLAGAVVDYTVAVKEAKKKVLPALDDEFAKDLELESLEALQTRVRTDLQRDGERRQANDMRNDLLRQLAARVTVDVPEALVGREIDRRLQEFVGQLVEQGMDPTKLGMDWGRFRDEQRTPAVDTVKSVLAIDDVARRERITVSEEEAEAEIARLAERTGRTVAAVRARLSEDGGIGRLYAGLRREKTVGFLLERVTISAG